MKKYLWTVLLGIVVARIKIVPKFPSPWSLCLDMTTQEILMRSGSQGKRMELMRSECCTSESDPLTTQILEIRWTIVLNLDHIRRQQFRLQNVQLHIFCPQAHNLIQSVDDSRSNKEHPESWSTGQSCQSMDQCQNVQKYVEFMSTEEKLVSILANEWMSKSEDDDHDDKKQNSCYSSHSPE